MAVAKEPAEPGFDVEKRGGEPALLLTRVLPVVDAPAATLGLFNVTTSPSADWTARQVIEAFPYDTRPRFLLHDRDRTFAGDVARRVRSMGIDEVLTAPGSPWQNAYCERLIGTIRRECLDHVVLLSERHLLQQEANTMRTPTDSSLTLVPEGSTDFVAIRQILQDVDSAWNRRDAKRFGELFLEAADFRFYTGRMLRGREEIEQFFATSFAELPADIRHESRLGQYRYLAPDIMIGESVMFVYPEGATEEQAHSSPILSTGVAMKKDGRWRLAAVRLMVPQEK